MKTIAIDVDPFAELPLMLGHVKDDLRIAHDELNSALFDQYIPSALELAETLTRRNIVARTVRWIIDEFPSYELVLPRGKTQSVSSIVYYHNSTETTTLRGPSSGSPVGTDYREDLRGEWGRLWPNVSEAWPLASTYVPSPIVVTFRAGWELGHVPHDVKLALRAAVGQMVEGDAEKARNVLEQLLSPRRIAW